MDESPRFYSPKQVAKMLSLGESTVYKLFRTRELTCIRTGRAVRISATELDAFVAKRCARNYS